MPMKTPLVNSNAVPIHVLKIQKMASIEVLKIVDKLSREYIQYLVNIKDSVYNRRNVRTADIPSVKPTRYGIKSNARTADFP